MSATADCEIFHPTSTGRNVRRGSSLVRWVVPRVLNGTRTVSCSSFAGPTPARSLGSHQALEPEREST